MKKKDLPEATKLTSYAMRKFSKNEVVTIDIFAKECRCLNCTPDDSMEILLEDKE